MVKNRLAEMQASAKHIKPSDLLANDAADVMIPLKEKDKAMSTSTANFFETLTNVTVDIDQVCSNKASVCPRTLICKHWKYHLFFDIISYHIICQKNDIISFISYR
jgi:hypothetical protein